MVDWFYVSLALDVHYSWRPYRQVVGGFWLFEECFVWGWEELKISLKGKKKEWKNREVQRERETEMENHSKTQQFVNAHMEEFGFYKRRNENHMFALLGANWVSPTEGDFFFHPQLVCD